MNPWLLIYLIGIPVTLIIVVATLAAGDTYKPKEDGVAILLTAFIWPLSLPLMLGDFIGRLLRRK